MITQCYAEAHEEPTSRRREGKEAWADHAAHFVVPTGVWSDGTPDHQM
jgi:hypothetical protein